jgi:hypothetical protein
MRLKWLNNPSGKHQKPCDLGLCKIKAEAKIATKAWTRKFRVTSRTTRPALLRALRPRNPSLPSLPGNGITVSTIGGALSQAVPFSPRGRRWRNAPDEGAVPDKVELLEPYPSPSASLPPLPQGERINLTSEIGSGFSEHAPTLKYQRHVLRDMPASP